MFTEEHPGCRNAIPFLTYNYLRMDRLFRCELWLVRLTDKQTDELKQLAGRREELPISTSLAETLLVAHGQTIDGKSDFSLVPVLARARRPDNQVPCQTCGCS